MSIKQTDLNAFFDSLLKPAEFKDYCPNGLQVAGKERITKLAFAVSATRASIEQAVSLQADALIVHHGLLWKFHGARPLTGAYGKRIFPLVKNDINLFAYHLPLDAHPLIGNAATLGNLIACEQQQAFGNYQGCATGIKGKLRTALSAAALQQKLSGILEHPVILASPDETALIQTLGIITGGANSDWQLAQQNGLDAYITGEISEHDWHESQENGIHMFAGGHHATERFGIQKLMQATQEQFNIECFYIDSPNPA